jgi:hypothetical protein
MFFLYRELDIYLITNISIFFKMITNTITIVVIIAMSLSIVSTSVVFAESQEYDPRSQEDVTFEDADYDQYVRPQSNSDYEQDADYDQYVRPQSNEVYFP